MQTYSCSVIDRVEAAVVVPVRRAVLRPHLDIAASMYPADSDVESRHFACVIEGVVVSVGSSFPEDGWRIRGMATLPDWRGRGLGSRILNAILEDLRSRGGGRVWCNARSSAAGFYLRHGFETSGDEFELPEIGPHFVMQKTIG